MQPFRGYVNYSEKIIILSEQYRLLILDEEIVCIRIKCVEV